MSRKGMPGSQAVRIEKREYLLLIILLTSVPVFLNNHDVILSVFSFIILLLYIYLGRGLARTATILTWSIAVPVGGAVPLALSIPASIIAVLAHKEEDYRHNGVQTQATLLAGTAIFYLPLIILNPLSLFPLFFFILTIIIKIFKINFMLAKTDVKLPVKEIRTVFGEEYMIPIIIKSKIKINYFIYLDGKLVSSGSSQGLSEIEITAKSRILGETIHTINLDIYDQDYWTKRSLGPYTIRVKTTLESIRSLLRIRRILLRYRERILRPLAYRIKIRVEKREKRGGGPSSLYGYGKAGYGSGRSGSGSGGIGWEGGEAGSSALETDLEMETAKAEEIVRVYFAPITLYEGTSGKWGIYGDYMGAREYYPGDRPRDIHWKKSISKQELIVKVYEPGSGGGGGGKRFLVVADWIPRNPVELDDLIKKTYSAILASPGEKLVLLRTPSGNMYFIRGGTGEVLLGLDHILRSEGLSLEYSYEGWTRKNTRGIARRMEEAGPPLSEIINYYKVLGAAIAESLRRMGVKEGTAFYIIHSDATSLRNYFISIALSRLELEESPPLESGWEELMQRIISEVRRI